MSKQAHRDLFDALQVRGLLEYGAVISTADVHALIGINFPEVATKAEFDALGLQELAAVDYVRNALLSQGKYLAGTRTGYRVLLPSENENQVRQYMSAADNKLVRALKLSRNTPVSSKTADQTEARIAMRRLGMNSRIAA